MVKCRTEALNAWFGSTQVLRELTIEVRACEILGVIGPANSGKTTFLRMLNRLNEIEPLFRSTGRVLLDGQDVRSLNVESVRRRVGMVFALPTPLPMSIFDNVAYGVRMDDRRRGEDLVEIVEAALQHAVLWDEVKDRLHTPAHQLSGGQQQRLCIARTLAVQPEVILFDEPCSGLDPISTAKVEEAMARLKTQYTLILVTNNVKQAARVADRTAFFLSGELVEVDATERMFTTPSDPRTDGYIRGKFG